MHVEALSQDFAAPEEQSGQGPNVLDANLRLGFLIHDVSRMRRVVVDRALRPLSVTRSQWWVLAFLSRRNAMSQTALAGELDLSKVAIGGLLDRLEAAGFIGRRHDKADRRARLVSMSTSGEQLVLAIRENVRDVEAGITGAIEREDLGAAAEALHRMKQNLLAMLDGEPADSEIASKNMGEEW